jgi:hypothetical protein
LWWFEEGVSEGFSIGEGSIEEGRECIVVEERIEGF